MLKLLLLCTVAFSSLGLQAQDHIGAFEYPFYAREVYNPQTQAGRNEMLILNSGVASLEKRIDMIRRARQSIELEYFIFDPDLSGQILITELIKKAREGVRVRILLDKSITIIRFDEYYADELRKYNIEVRYYNRAVDPATAQFRNHRKLLSIDNQEAITGGRNIGLDYFDMSPTYNFHDRDVWVSGGIVRAMVDSFNAFWDSNRAVIPVVPNITEYSRLHRDHRRRQDPRWAVHQRRQEEARIFMQESAEVIEMKSRVAHVGGSYLARKEKHVCPSVTFVSDKPTGTFFRSLNSDYRTQDRVLNHVLKKRFSDSRESVVIETPYFMLNRSFGGSLADVLDRKLDVSVLTNSLGSTDAIYVSANFYRQIGPWIERGLRTYVHTSLFDGDEVLEDSIRQTRYGIHSKTYVFDDKDFTIGTYNVDNRSDYFNTEMTLFCDGSPELTAILMQDIERRKDNAYILQGSGDRAVDRLGNEADAYGGASRSQIRLMKGIRLPSQLLEFLM
jgi:cardiolipin synthase C